MEPTNALSWWKDLADIGQSVGTLAIAVVAGAWALWRFRLREERFPHIETSADIDFIGEHGNDWIVELVANIENKGTAQHKMFLLKFDVFSLRADDELADAEEYGGQVNFPNLIRDGSFLPARYKYFYIDPGIKAKFSFVTRVAKKEEYLMFHYRFYYDDNPKHMHVAEKTVKLPQLTR